MVNSRRPLPSAWSWVRPRRHRDCAAGLFLDASGALGPRRFVSRLERADGSHIKVEDVRCLLKSELAGLFSPHVEKLRTLEGLRRLAFSTHSRRLN
jgi:hypothetical protein